EAACALRVVLDEIAVHIDTVEQHLCDRLVPARTNESGAEIAAAEMHGHRHVVRQILERHIDDARFQRRDLRRIVAARSNTLAILGIAQEPEKYLVKLQI